MVDKYIKKIYYIPFWEEYNSEKLHQLQINKIIKIYKHLEEIIND